MAGEGSSGVAQATEYPVVKNAGLAGVLSFFIVGAGQLYLGNLGKAAAFFGACFAAFLLFGDVGIFAWFAAMLWSVADAVISANKYNKLHWEAENRKRLEADAIAKLEAETVSSQDIVNQIEKLYQLRSNELLEESEYSDRKAKVLDILHTRRPREAPEDFLSALVPLARSGALSSDELKSIKTLVL